MMETIAVQTGFVWFTGSGGTPVINNLDSESATSALAAAQGKALKDMIDNIEIGGEGDNGWSPVLAGVVDGERIVSRVVDWVGGEGTKPAIGKYIGPAGLVDTPAEATNIRGAQGVQGNPGNPGSDGIPGADGTDGTDGTDGRNPEYQFSATHLQYRLVGDTQWIDLLPISNLTGPAGSDGAPGTPGADGDPGTDGKSVELQKSATHIQWRLVGDTTWLNLVALIDIKGDKGDTGNPGADGSDGSDGAPGRSVQFFTAIPGGSFGTDYFAGDIVKL